MSGSLAGMGSSIAVGGRNKKERAAGKNNEWCEKEWRKFKHFKSNAGLSHGVLSVSSHSQKYLKCRSRSKPELLYRPYHQNEITKISLVQPVTWTTELIY
eukprot:scaffold12320_cov76-Amphora_coffeaeformis.AAC.1